MRIIRLETRRRLMRMTMSSTVLSERMVLKNRDRIGKQRELKALHRLKLTSVAGPRFNGDVNVTAVNILFVLCLSDWHNSNERY